MKNVFKSVMFVLVLLLSVALVRAGADPVLTDPGAKSVNEGALLSISLASTAPDLGEYTNFTACQLPSASGTCTGSKVPFSIGTTTANITNLSNTAGQFNWTPDYTQSGTYYFNFSTSDADPTFLSTKVVTVTVNNVAPTITATALSLGGDTQTRSDPNHDTRDLREQNISGTITLTNNGPEAVNAIVAVPTAAGGFSIGSDSISGININYTFPKKTLAVGESMAVPVLIRVPPRLSAIDSNFVRLTPTVATLAFSATPAVSGGTITGNSLLSLQAENNLKLKNVKIKHGDKSQTVRDGDTVQKLKAGEKVTLEIEVESRFTDKENVKINGVTVRAKSDSNIDINEDESVNDLSGNDKDTVKLESTISDTADDGTSDVIITVAGIDEFGAKHGEKMTVRFEVKRNSHEISIASLSLNPSTVSCDGNSNLKVTMKNTGRRDEDEVYVHVEAQDLSYGKISDKLSLDKDDEISMNFNIPVAESVKPGTYHVNVETYYNTGTLSTSDAAVLTVAACKPIAEEKPTTPPPATLTPPVVEQPKPQVVTAPVAPAKKSFTDTPQYIALLALGYVAVLGGGGLLLFKLIQKP